MTDRVDKKAQLPLNSNQVHLYEVEYLSSAVEASRNRGANITEHFISRRGYEGGDGVYEFLRHQADIRGEQIFPIGIKHRTIVELDEPTDLNNLDVGYLEGKLTVEQATKRVKRGQFIILQ